MAIFTAPHLHHADSTPGTKVRKPGSSLILVAHGSTENAESSAPAWALAAALRRRNIFGEVHCCFWKEEPSLREALYQVQFSDVYIAPVFISEGYFTTTIIPRELELEGPITERMDLTLKYCEPVGNHPAMTELLKLRAREVAPQAAPEETTLLIVGHGTGLHSHSRLAAEHQAKRLRETTDYAEILAVYMEEEPRVEGWHRLASQPNVVIVPFFISDGLHSAEDIPTSLGFAPGEKGGHLETLGRHLYYAGAIGSHPHMAEVVLDQVAAFDATYNVLMAEAGGRETYGVSGEDIGEHSLAGVE